MDEYVNHVFLRGRIKTMFRHGKYSYADVEVKDTNHLTGEGVFRVIFNTPDDIRGLIVGDKVNVRGSLTNQVLIIDGENENKGTGAMIMAKKVEIANRILHEFCDFKDIPEMKGVYSEDRNDIFMVGKVEKTDCTKTNLVRVTVTVEGKNAGKFTYVAFGAAMKPIRKCEPGDRIAIAGTYTSRVFGEKKKKNEVTIYGLVANDVYVFDGTTAPEGDFYE